MSDELPPPVDRYSYTQTFKGPDGKTYRWDPDFGTWYYELSKEEWDAQSHMTKFGWIYWIICLTLFAIFVEVFKS